MDDHIGVRSRSNLFRVETEIVPTTQEQTVWAQISFIVIDSH